MIQGLSDPISSGVLSRAETPFGALKSANQYVEFALDPSKGLTRKRYMWRSEGAIFDDTHFENTSVPGAINIEISSGSDDALLRSAFMGRYQSQSLAIPGQGVVIPNVERSDGLVSLPNGLVAVGAGIHRDGQSGWHVASDSVSEFLGLVFDSDGANAVLISDGEHKAGSPVSQENWNIQTLKGNFTAEKGYIYNQPYTGALFVGLVDPAINRFVPLHKFEVDGEPSLSNPNLCPMVIVDGNSESGSVRADVGGLQYSRYGSGNPIGANRVTPVQRETSGGFISSGATFNNNAIDARAEPGTPLVSFRRRDGNEGVPLRQEELNVSTGKEITVFFWDEYDPSTSLTGQNFRRPHSANDDKETKVDVDTEATDYSLTTAVHRRTIRFPAGNEKKSLVRESVESRVPLDATRVVTGVYHDSSTDVTPLAFEIKEGF